MKNEDYHAEEMTDQEYADMMYQKEMDESWQELTEENELPVININTLEPSGELIEMQFGNEKPEKLSTTSNDIAQAIIQNVLEGNVNPLDVAVKKKLITDAFEIVMKNESVKNLMIDEVNKYSKGDATALGAKLSLSNRATYQYEKDATWWAIKKQMAPLESQLRAQEEKIKICCKTGHSLVDDDGIIIAAVVPAPASTSICVSFKKK